MKDSELLSFLKDLESDSVERKESMSHPDRIREAICAFANDPPGNQKPGVIFIGAKDDDSCSNLTIDDKLLLNLAAMRDDGLIQPFPSMEVKKKTLNGCKMAVVIVQPSLAPPIRFKGRTWIRVGPRRAYATPEEELRLAEKRCSLDLPYDLKPLSMANIDDFDIELFEHHYLPNAVALEVVGQNKRKPEDQLKALRFLTPEGIPTILGVLIIEKESRNYIPGAYIQFLRIDGTELTDPIRSKKKSAALYVIYWDDWMIYWRLIITFRPLSRLVRWR
jgi:ATP-dependent DNA helicase RecG